MDQINVAVGEPFTLNIFGSDDKISEDSPGNFIFQDYDSEYLRIESCRWLYQASPVDPRTTLSVRLLPLKKGTTEAVARVQLSKFSPLYITKKYKINITVMQE